MLSPEEERSVQLRAGFFTLLGLCLIAGLVTYFGRFGEGTRRYYEIRVEYPNASGLLSGAEVLMAGAKIGKVGRGPEILPDGRGVSVLLKIYQEVSIPADAKFSIGTSGLLGDRFVDITPQVGSREERMLQPGEVVRGTSGSGMDLLAAQGGQLLEEIRSAIQKIDRFILKLDQELLSEGNLSAIRATVQQLELAVGTLNATAAQLKQSIEVTEPKLGKVLEEASAALSAGRKALEEGERAARELQSAVGRAREMVQAVQNSPGPVGVLLNDAESAKNLRIFLRNLRERGVLFYRDRKE